MHAFKIVSSLVILLVLITAAGIYSTHTLSSSSKKLETHISQIVKDTQSGNWDKAKQGLDSMKKDWSKTELSWAILLDNIEIDNIDTTISRLSEFIDTKDTPLALGEAAILKQYVKHIPQKEAFKIKNIL